MTPEGIKPWKKLIDAILKMDCPRKNTNVRAFIGAVNHYKLLWPWQAHVLAPLAKLTGRGKFQWTATHDAGFLKEMKAIITADAMNAFPDYSIPFHIHTNASDFQLGAAIIQRRKPIAYYSKKLTAAQCNYTTTEKELLAIVTTLKHYCKMLLGSKIIVFTDHKNLSFQMLSVQRILRWRLFVDQFDCTLQYILGQKNVLADCFLRLPLMEKPSAGIKEQQGLGHLIDFKNISIPKDDEEILDGETFLNIACKLVTAALPTTEQSNFKNDESYYNELGECLLNLPSLEEMENPITITNIVNHQATDLSLQQKIMSNPDFFCHEESEGFEVIHTPGPK